MIEIRIAKQIIKRYILSSRLRRRSDCVQHEFNITIGNFVLVQSTTLLFPTTAIKENVVFK
jgi:hypothetical protein